MTPTGFGPYLPVPCHLTVDVGLRQHINAKVSQDIHGSVIYHARQIKPTAPSA